MSKRRIAMHEYRQVIYRLRQGQSSRTIAQETAFGRNKIKDIRKIALAQGWLNVQAPLPEEALLAEYFNYRVGENNNNSPKALLYTKEIETWVTSGVQASTIHQHLVTTYGFKGAYSCVQRFIQKIKKEQSLTLTVPLIFQPGEAAQVDFGKGPRLYDERLGKEVETWFFVMTLCFSRHQYAELVTHQDIETWLKCHQNAFNWFGGVPKKIIIDNPKCAITKASYHDPIVQRSYEDFAQNYSFIISACPPREPKKKGRVESGVKYIKKNFLPLKTFKSLQEANQQLKNWINGTAGNRTHGSTFKKPLTEFMEIERSVLLSLPDRQPEISVWKKVKLYKDCHIRYLQCRYSAPYHLYEKELWLKITPTLVMIYFDHQCVASHPRLFKPGDISTKLEHLPPKAKTYLTQDASWCLEKSTEIGECCNFVIENLLTDPVCDLLRQAQSIIALSLTYGNARLELACQRAMTFHAINYRTIKEILKQGLDYLQLGTENTFNSLSKIYLGEGKFQRDFIHHPFH